TGENSVIHGGGEQSGGGPGTGRIPDHQRSGGAARRSATRAAVLGKPLPRDQADEARRRAPLLSPRRPRSSARHSPSPLWRGLHHPWRPASAARAGRALRTECLATGRAAADRQPAEEDDAAAETEEAEGEGALRLPLLRGAAGHERPQSSEDEHVAAARAMAPSAGGLAREEVQKLQAALHDLTECRRLLDAA